MSISTCPRCSEKISIPPGVSSTAKVRCPLCRQQYVLADALAAMPPLLEVVEESGEENLQSDWQSTAATALGTPVDELAETVDLSHDSVESDSTVDFGAPLSEEPLASAPTEEELWMSDDDTQIDDKGFATSEPLVRDVADDHDPIEVSSIDEQTIIEFEKRKRDADKVPPLLGEEEPLELDFDELQPTDEAGSVDATIDFEPSEPVGEAAEEELELNFDEGEPTAEFSPEATIEFEPSEPSSEAAEEEIELNFDEAAPAAESDARMASTIEFSAIDAGEATDQADEPLIDFGEAAAGAEAMEENPLGFVRDPGQPPAEGEELELDFGEPVAAGEGEPAAEEADEEDGKKKKKAKKAKKEKKVKAAEESDEQEPRRRSLVGTLVSVMLGAVVALPLSIYGIMWMGPDYDFFRVGKTLAGWNIPLPAAFSKAPQQRVVAIAPQSAPPAQAAPAASQQPATADNAAPQTPEPASAPSEPAVEQPAATEPSAPAPATTEPPAAAAAQATEQPAAPSEPSVTSEPNASSPEVPSATAATESPKPATESPEPEMPAPAAADKPIAGAAEEKSPPTEAIAETKPAAPAATEKMPAEEMPLEGKSLDEKSAEVAVEKPEPRVAAKPADEELPLPDLDEKPKTAARPVPSADQKPELGDEPAPAADVDLLGPADAPEYTVADLGKVIQATGASEAKLLAAQGSKDESAIKTARSQFYLNFFRLAEVVTFATDAAGDGRLAAERESLERIVLQLASDRKRLDALKFNAARWMTFSKRTTPGIVVAGTVVGSEMAGKMHRVKLGIGLTSEEPVVAIVMRDDPQLHSGDKALVLGSIVERPGERLVGYDGDEPAAVWSGMVLKLPAER